ncbi:DUF2092 domain-containing protein [Mucilaginibacter agri]|uniref:DUF2092 domain-containing protein n=1 Tax=Mucilaginibacter agri TaxID=2695265 RepID=A0A965ZMD4_9SPHI|nr:DUF2092 domain-containing protein [Mucilaginibacter agri]NCD72361.1 DUF2092 domain-containing protein [Mucilaginibacter agri]
MRSKKRLGLLGLILIISTVVRAQNVDTSALYIMQRMAGTLKNMTSCAVHVQAFYDTPTDDLGLIKRSKDETVYAHFPDKLMIDNKEDNERHALLYNGKKLVYYSFENNSYSLIDSVPNNVLETIQVLSKTYGIEVPAADYFYPSFVDDIKSTATALKLVGTTVVNGEECFHIAGKDSTMSYQFWIKNDLLFLPVKMVIVYNNRPGTPQYEAIYSGWNLNADLPASAFEFTVPPNAQKIAIKPTSAQQ